MSMPRPKMRLLLQHVRTYLRTVHDQLVGNYQEDELGTITDPQGIREVAEAAEQITNLDTVLMELQQ